MSQKKTLFGYAFGWALVYGLTRQVRATLDAYSAFLGGGEADPARRPTGGGQRVIEKKSAEFRAGPAGG